MIFGLQKKFLKRTDLELTMDIVNSEEFKACNEVFKAMLVKIKQDWTSEVKQKQSISREDMNKMYEQSEVFSLNTAVSLFNRTVFEMVYYFCKRGQENLRNFR